MLVVPAPALPDGADNLAVLAADAVKIVVGCHRC